jgi:hypothetical protein
LSAAIGRSVGAQSLPFNTFTFVNQQKAIEFAVEGTTWRCALTDFECRKAEPRRQPDDAPRLSPDKKWEAIVVNYNVAIRETGIATRTPAMLSFDGSEGNAYEQSSIAWSPYRINFDGSALTRLGADGDVNHTLPCRPISVTSWTPTRARQCAGQRPRSLGGLLFHPEFYQVAVSAAGCHDNRMDKIWWNEQWMGWPLGPQYSASPTSTTPIGWKATCCWSSAKWIPTSTRRLRCKWSIS